MIKLDPSSVTQMQALMDLLDHTRTGHANQSTSSAGLAIGTSATTAVKVVNTVTYSNNGSTATAVSATPGVGIARSKTTAEVAFTATTHDIPANPNTVMEQVYLVLLDSAGTLSLVGGGITPGTNTAPLPSRPLVCPSANPYGVGVVQITNPGSGYALTATVKFSSPPAGFNGRTATGHLLFNGGTVTQVVIDDPGVYPTSTAPTVTVTDATGSSGASFAGTVYMQQQGIYGQTFGTPIGYVRIAVNAGTPGSGTNFVAGTTALSDARMTVTYTNVIGEYGAVFYQTQ